MGINGGYFPAIGRIYLRILTVLDENCERARIVFSSSFSMQIFLLLLYFFRPKWFFTYIIMWLYAWETFWPN